MSTPESPWRSLTLPLEVPPHPESRDPEPESPVSREIRRYRDRLVAEGYSPRTVGIYATHLSRWTMRLGRPAGEATVGELRHYLLDLATRVRSSTLGQTRSALRLHYAVVVGRPLLAEVVRAVRPRPGTPARALDPDQLWKMTQAARSSRERLFVILLAQVGLRPGELLGLRVRDVDFASRSLRVTASCGHVHRTASFPPGVGLDLANEMRGRFPHQWVFPGAGECGERPLASRTLQKTLARLSRRAGIEPPVSPRVLRRTFAKNLVRGGIARGELARKLGLRAEAGARRYLEDRG